MKQSSLAKTRIELSLYEIKLIVSFGYGVLILETLAPKLSHSHLFIFGLVLENRVERWRVQLVELIQETGHKIHSVIPEIDSLQVCTKFLNRFISPLPFAHAIRLQRK